MPTALPVPAVQAASTSAAAAGSSRFAPHSFQYNGRVALALLPSLAVVAGYGGSAVAAALVVSLLRRLHTRLAPLVEQRDVRHRSCTCACTAGAAFAVERGSHPKSMRPSAAALAMRASPRNAPRNLAPRPRQLGLMATYILDALRYKEGAFTAAWLTMGAANAAAVFSGLLMKSEAPLALTLLTFVLNAAALFLAGAPGRRRRARGAGRAGGRGQNGVAAAPAPQSCGQRSQRSVEVAAALQPAHPRMPPSPAPAAHPARAQASGPRCSSASCSCSTRGW